MDSAHHAEARFQTQARSIRKIVKVYARLQHPVAPFQTRNFAGRTRIPLRTGQDLHLSGGALHMECRAGQYRENCRYFGRGAVAFIGSTERAWQIVALVMKPAMLVSLMGQLMVLLAIPLSRKKTAASGWLSLREFHISLCLQQHKNFAEFAA